MATIRMTRQKDAIRCAIDGMPPVFSAEELFGEVAAGGVGIATVYRHLRERRRQGLIHSYTCGTRTLYSLRQTVHAHFHCEECGRIDHPSLQDIGFLRKRIPGEVCHVQIDVTGRCLRCAGRKRLNIDTTKEMT